MGFVKLSCFVKIDPPELKINIESTRIVGKRSYENIKNRLKSIENQKHVCSKRFFGSCIFWSFFDNI